MKNGALWMSLKSHSVKPVPKFHVKIRNRAAAFQFWGQAAYPSLYEISRSVSALLPCKASVYCYNAQPVLIIGNEKRKACATGGCSKKPMPLTKIKYYTLFLRGTIQSTTTTRKPLLTVLLIQLYCIWNNRVAGFTVEQASSGALLLLSMDGSTSTKI